MTSLLISRALQVTSGYLVIRSLGHLVTPSLAQSVTQTLNNLITGHPIIWSLENVQKNSKKKSTHPPQSVHSTLVKCPYSSSKHSSTEKVLIYIDGVTMGYKKDFNIKSLMLGKFQNSIKIGLFFLKNHVKIRKFTRFLELYCFIKKM